MSTSQGASSFSFQVQLDVTSQGKTLKEGKAGKFTVLSDESVAAGGSGSAPSPLQYLLLALGF